MSFRRFVYLVTEDAKRSNFLLRRIDMSRFFLPKCKRDELLADPPPLEEADLPPAAIRFDPPTSALVGNEDMAFMLFPGGEGSGRNDKVVATDPTGRALLYDPEWRSVRSVPSFTAPKLAPISMAVGNSHYVLDRNFSVNDCDDCFDRFFHDDDWYCQSLPPPPYVHAYGGASLEEGTSHVESYAVVGGSSIWISESTLGTHCFDTVSRAWSKVGDWALPFCGHAQYVPEHRLWFGLPSDDIDNYYSAGEDDDGSIYTSDLAVTPPAIRRVWADDLTRPEWTGRWSYLVHLGQSRFCHAMFFRTKRPIELQYRSYVVLTGMEAEVCGRGGGELRMVKHRSELYRLVDKIVHWVL